MTHHDHGGPQGLPHADAVFFRTFTLVLIGLAAIGVLAFGLAQVIGYRDTTKSPERIAAAERRTEPFGRVSLEGEEAVTLAKAEAPVAAAPKALEGGEAIYGAVCAACHSLGVAGAPKTGDAVAWEPRVAQGWDTLTDHAIKGFQGSAGLMPARGGRADLGDEGVKQAIGHMLAAAGLDGIVPDEFKPGAAAPAVADPAAVAAPPAEADPAAVAAPPAEADPAAVAAPPAEADPAAVAAPPAEADPAAVAAPPAEADPAAVAPPPAEADPAAVAPATTPTAELLAKGEEVYNAACTVCHAVGIAGAPKTGVAEDWNDRVPQGRDTLYDHAINGFVGSKGVMPAKGGRTDLSDDDVKAAVEYMLSRLTVTAT